MSTLESSINHEKILDLFKEINGNKNGTESKGSLVSLENLTILVETILSYLKKVQSGDRTNKDYGFTSFLESLSRNVQWYVEADENRHLRKEIERSLHTYLPDHPQDLWWWRLHEFKRAILSSSPSRKSCNTIYAFLGIPYHYWRHLDHRFLSLINPNWITSLSKENTSHNSSLTTSFEQIYMLPADWIGFYHGEGDCIFSRVVIRKRIEQNCYSIAFFNLNDEYFEGLAELKDHTLKGIIKGYRSVIDLSIPLNLNNDPNKLQVLSGTIRHISPVFNQETLFTITFVGLNHLPDIFDKLEGSVLSERKKVWNLLGGLKPQLRDRLEKIKSLHVQQLPIKTAIFRWHRLEELDRQLEKSPVNSFISSTKDASTLFQLRQLK